MRHIVRAGIIGGVIAFIWGCISWGVLPWHKRTINRFDGQEELAQVIMGAAKRDGIYVLEKKGMCPSYKSCEGGTFVFASVSSMGSSMNSPRALVIGFFTQVIAAFIAAWLFVKSKIHDYWKGVWYIVVVALFAGVVIHIPYWNWWGFPFNYTLCGILDLALTWFLAGLAIVKFARRAH